MFFLCYAAPDSWKATGCVLCTGLLLELVTVAAALSVLVRLFMLCLFFVLSALSIVKVNAVGLGPYERPTEGIGWTYSLRSGGMSEPFNHRGKVRNTFGQHTFGLFPVFRSDVLSEKNILSSLRRIQQTHLRE